MDTMRDLKEKAALAAGLPAGFASVIQGETLEDMTEDARQIRATLETAYSPTPKAAPLGAAERPVSNDRYKVFGERMGEAMTQARHGGWVPLSPLEK